MAAPAGIPFGQYVLGKRLARGGMAEVFLARQRGVEGFDRRVAVKRILPHLADSREFIKMFLDEARYAARLAHPNIVHIYELGQFEESYFIAMEFVDGVHSGQLIKHAASEPIPPVLVARVGADAAGALAYAHRQEDADGRALGLVHRDVSPQNIMISYDGVVKLVDFGIAKAVSKAEETQPGIVKGKYAYMSPEQTTRKQLDGRSDVFSLGVVLWEILAGRNIVDRGDVVEAMKVMRDCRFPRVEQVAPHVPAPLASAVGWALERDRNDRPSAAQLQASLEEIIKDSPILATPLQLGEWIRPRFPRTSTTGMVPSIDEGRRTNPPPSAARGPAPGQGTQVAHFTGEGPVATRVTAITDAPPALGRIATPRTEPGSQPHLQPQPLPGMPVTPGPPAHMTPPPGPPAHMTPPPGVPPRATPPPIPRPPTQDEFTIALPSLDVGDGTTRVVEVRLPTSERIRRRSPLLLAAAGVLAVAAIVAVVIGSGALSGSRTELAGVTPDAATVARSLPVDASSPLVDPSPELDARDPDPVPDAGVPAPDAGAPIPAPTATLEIVARPPGAKASVDGARPRSTPLVLRDHPPGKVTIVVTRDKYAPTTRIVDLAAGEHRTLEIVLEKKSGSGGSSGARGGYLTARTQPYSVVYLGSRKLGETPFAGVELPVGRHVLTFKNPGMRPVTRTVTVKAGETIKLNFNL
ncbi:MAG TPA: protein kinase [Kofleriaceae bacterium]|nr:protein kinase [Kofleriaceae bacterium]